jgi:hypothetical protein
MSSGFYISSVGHIQFNLLPVNTGPPKKVVILKVGANILQGTMRNGDKIHLMFT